MMLRIWNILLLGSLFTIIVNCSSSTLVQESELQWGHLDSFARVSLLNVSPGDEIAICSDDPKEDGLLVEQSLKDWFGAVGYAKHLKFTVDCDRTKDADAAVYSMLFARGPFREMCTPNVVGFAYPITNRRGGVLIRCMPAIRSQPTFMTSHTLHETGHLMGVCDQYSIDKTGKLDAAIGMHETCSDYYRTENATRSVMNAGSGRNGSLSPDDIRGIQVFAERQEISSRGLWKQVLLNENSAPVATANVDSSPATPSTRPAAPGSTAAPTSPSSPSPTAQLDCNADYSSIRSGSSGICKNKSSGFCYRYSSGSVQYNSGSISCTE